CSTPPDTVSSVDYLDFW
nr:immunoglobulin heavy chain junction region [Macaca mulatta]MOW45452.1 immunoglobulin heavy chain junction region [Macaca mulatta]MOW45546.1 immunoglobulin heavy chain junction region [Macaca mulatta]MOW46098.1 immunoglobulin heavy chain junction region [Macaca mulatta]MOW46128.1 immunoglobulin heavy chain junction region [Macaca mulatta]